MAKGRRTRAEVVKLVGKIDALRAKGATLDEAAAKFGLARSVYDRAKKRGAGNSGAVDISAFVPPKKKKYKRGEVDLDSVSSVAGRITALDKRLQKVAVLRQERMELARVLQKLLQRHP